MYYHLGKNNDKLELYRAMRGSSKNEAANKVTEKALMTTGKLREEMANGEKMRCCHIMRSTKII